MYWMNKSHCKKNKVCFNRKYHHYGIKSFIEYSGMSKSEIDRVIDSFTNPILFEKDKNGNFKRDNNFNLIPTFKIK